MPVPLRTLTQGTVARRPVHGQQVKLRLVIDAAVEIEKRFSPSRNVSNEFN
jgi:hypothetical protein